MIDLRSDTVTRPSPAMLEAMAQAPVGDDVYGEDPTVAELESRTAELLGHEAGLFVPTGSMANLLGVWLHVPVGSEVLCDSIAHVARAEMGAHGALHGVLDHVADTDLVFGLIPAGTGNDTARSLGIPVKDVDAAVDLVIAGHVRTIDLARTDEAYVATVVASGFDSKVNERANAMSWPRGNMRYNIAIVKELSAFEPLDFTLTLDGVTIERPRGPPSSRDAQGSD